MIQELNRKQIKLARLFAILRGHGVGLPPGVEAELLARCPARGRISITRIPHLHFALEVALGWKDRLKEDSTLAELAALLILRLKAQVDGRPINKGLFDQISLGARRWFLGCTEDMAFLRREHWEQLLAEPRLPLPRLASGNVLWKEASKSGLQDLLSAIMRLQQDIRSGSRRDESDLGEWEDPTLRGYLRDDDVFLRGEQPANFKVDEARYTGKKALKLRESSAHTQMMAGATIFVAVAPRWFADWVADGDLESRPDDDLFHEMAWMIQIFFGLPFRDLLDLDLGEGKPKLGRILPNALLLKINGGYYHSAACWLADDLILPLPSHLREVLTELLRRNPGAKCLRNLFRGSAVMDAHRTFCRNVIKKYLPGYKTNATRVDRVWYRMAVLSCDLPVSLVGLMRGHPVGGGRAQSAYLSVANRLVVEASQHMHRQFYGYAGVPFTEQPFQIEAPDHLFGKDAMGLRQFSTITMERIGRAKTYNELVACVVRVLRGLGFRRLNATENPVCLFRDDIVPLLEVRDKLAGDWVPPRFVPISLEFEKLLLQLKEVFGDHPVILYGRNGVGCGIEELSAPERSELQLILQDEAHYNAGRTGLYNALLMRRCGDVIRQAIIGHGPRATNLYGNQLPVPPRRVIEHARSIMTSICSEEGLDACAVALTFKLKEFLKLNSVPTRPQISTGSSTASSVALGVVPAEMHSPMTYFEKGVKETVYDSYHNCQFPESYETSKRSHRRERGWPLDHAGLLGAVALELNLPLELLLQYQAYYTYESFLFDCHSKQVFFRVILKHHDDGGLSEFPVPVCSFQDEGTNRLMGLVRYRFGSELFTLGYKAQHSAQTYLATKAKKMQSHSEEVAVPLPPVACVFEDLAQEERIRVLESRLFGRKEIWKEQVGMKLAFLLGKETGVLSPLQAFDLLNRVTTCRCAVWYAPLLAGVFSDRSTLGLNNFFIEDLFDVKNGSPTSIKDLIGRPWTDKTKASEAKLTPGRTKKLTRALTALSDGEVRMLFVDANDGAEAGDRCGVQISGSQLNPRFASLRAKISELSARDWKQILPEDEYTGRQSLPDRMTRFIRKAGFSGKTARKVAFQFGEFLRLEGKLSLSEPLPLLRPGDLDEVIERAGQLILDGYHPRNKAETPTTKFARAERIRPELLGMLKVAEVTRMRSKEIRNLYAEDIVVDATHLYFAVRGGKTDNSRRVIMGAKGAFLLIEEQWAHMKGRQKGGSRVFDNLFSHLSHHASATATIRRRLSVAADRPLTPYDLRHAGIVVDLQVVINDRLKTGNFWHAVADLSVQVGHGSIELTLATYVGTAVFLYM